MPDKSEIDAQLEGLILTTPDENVGEEYLDRLEALFAAEFAGEEFVLVSGRLVSAMTSDPEDAARMAEAAYGLIGPAERPRGFREDFKTAITLGAAAWCVWAAVVILWRGGL
jgi:hypothetical protein